MAQFHTFAISNSSTATTTFTITIPNNIAVGEDLYILAVSRDHTVATDKYTCTDNDVTGNTWSEKIISSDRKTTLFWKKATAETAGKTVTLAGGVGSFTGGLSAFLGGYEGDPTYDLTMEENASADETHAGFIPANPGSFIVFGVTNDSNDNDVTSIASAGLGTMEPEQWAAESTGGSDCKATMAGIDNPSDTPTGNFTWSQSNGTTDSIVFSIKPGIFASDSIVLSEWIDIIVGDTRKFAISDAITLSEFYIPPGWQFTKLESNINVNETVTMRSKMFIDVYDEVTLSEDFDTPFIIYDLISVQESVEILSYINLSVYEEITVSIHCLPNTMEIFPYEEITLSEYSDFSFSGFQMPMSRPQGSLLYQYDDWGSISPGTGLTIGGGL